MSKAEEDSQGADGRHSENYLKSTRSASRPSKENAPTTLGQTSQRSEPGEARKKEDSGPKQNEEPKPNEERLSGIVAWPTHERYGKIGMTETENATASQRSPDETEETQAGSSVVPAKNFERETSATMSLIDESCSLLRDCMRTQVKKHDLDRPLDYRQINSIANLGDKIAKLAKVKVEAIKEARKHV